MLFQTAEAHILSLYLHSSNKIHNNCPYLYAFVPSLDPNGVGIFLSLANGANLVRKAENVFLQSCGVLFCVNLKCIDLDVKIQDHGEI